MPTSVRLDRKTEREVERLARARGQTKSEVIRRAILELSRNEAAESRAGTAYERVASLIGCVRGGPADLSTRTGQRFRQLLQRKRAARR